MTLLIPSACESPVEISEPPNIILIFADDLGFEIINDGDDDLYSTPHIDSLIAGGMNFTSAHSTPLCTPSRVQIMTGKYGYQNYIGFGQLDPRQLTFGDFMRMSGYETAVVGKWQLFGNARQRELTGRDGALPEQTGFDESVLWQVREKNGSRFKDPWIVINGRRDQEFSGRYGPDLFGDYIEGFLGRERERPFFLYYPMVLTHDPYQPTPASEGYEDFSLATGENDQKWFADNVSYMDRAVGRIVSNLRRNDLLENTIILFIGDNGTDRDIVSAFQAGDVKGNKGYTNRLGTHVPFIAHWPEVIKPAKNDNLVDLTDVLPSLIEVSGASIPDSVGLDGKSLYGQFLQRRGAFERDWIYCYYAPEWGNFNHISWAHDKHYKYYSDGRFFNLESDPDEKSPLNFEDLDDRSKENYTHLKKVVEERPIPDPPGA